MTTSASSWLPDLLARRQAALAFQSDTDVRNAIKIDDKEHADKGGLVDIDAMDDVEDRGERQRRRV